MSKSKTATPAAPMSLRSATLAHLGKRRKLIVGTGVVAALLAGLYLYSAYTVQRDVAAAIEKNAISATPAEIHAQTQTAFSKLSFADDPFFDSAQFTDFTNLVSANILARLHSTKGEAERQAIYDEMWWPGMRNRAKAGFAQRDAVSAAFAAESTRSGVLQIAADACKHKGMTRKDLTSTNKGETADYNAAQSDMAFKVYQLASKDCK